MILKNNKAIRLTVFLGIALIVNIALLESAPRILNPVQNPNTQSASINEGVILFSGRQYREAIVRFLEALNESVMSNERAIGHLYLAASYFEVGEIEKCRANLKKLFDISRENKMDEYHFSLGFLSEYSRVFDQIKSIQIIAAKSVEEVPVALGEKPHSLDDLGRESTFPWLLVGGIAFVVFIAAALFLKKKSTTSAPSKLEVTPTSFSFPSAGGTSSIGVSNTGGGTMSWTASILSGDWFSISPLSGKNNGTITINCNPNAETSSRSGLIRVTANGATGSPMDITVDQGPAVVSSPILSVSPASLSLSSSSGTSQISVTNGGGGNLNWTVAVQGAPAWVSVSPSSGTNAGTVNVTYSASSGSVRTATIRFSATGVQGSPADVQVSQAASTEPYLAVSPASLSFSATLSTQSFSVVNTGGGTLTWTAAVQGGATWISINPSSGTGNNSVSVTGSANSGASRSGTVRVTAGAAQGSPKDVTITQASGTVPTPILTVTPTSFSFTKTGGTQTLNISNTGGGTLSWTAAVTSGASWLSLSTASGTGNATVTVICGATTIGSSRTGTINITASGAQGSPINIAVTQEGTPILSVSPSSLDFTISGGTKTFNITNTGTGVLSWTVSVQNNPSWVSYTPISGTGNGTVTVVVAQNSGLSRGVAIVVSAAGALPNTQYVQVNQPGSGLSISRLYNAGMSNKTIKGR